MNASARSAAGVLASLAWLFLAAAGFQDAAPVRAPVPDEAAQKEAARLIRDVFKEEYAGTRPADRRKLAKTLLEQARETNDDLTMRFVLLRETRDVASQAGDVKTAMSAIDDLEALFVIDAPAMKAAALAVAGKSTRDPAELKEIATQCLDLIDEALAADRYDVASQAAGLATDLAKRAKESGLVAEIGAKSKEIASFKARYAAIRKAEETLAKSPDDPAANLTVGQYYALVKEDWGRGLPFLAKGSDEELKELSSKDLSNPAEASEQLAVADGWWERAEKENGPSKDILRGRAILWYRRGLDGGLQGMSRTKAQKRIIDYRREKGGGWEDVSDPALWGREGKPGGAIVLAPVGDGQENLTLQKFPEGEFDGMSGRLRFNDPKKCHAYFIIEGNSRGVAIDPTEPSVYECRLVGNGWQAGKREAILKRDEYLLKVLLIKGEWVVFVNGDSKIKFRAEVDSLKGAMLHAHWETVTFDQLKLRYKS